MIDKKLRELGTKVIGEYLSNKNNITLLESRIFEASCTSNTNSTTNYNHLYRHNLYSCVGYLTQGWVREYNEDIKAKLCGFALNAYHNYVNEEEETDRYLTEEVGVDEGVLVCPKCHSVKTFSYTKQVRSADEGTSVFARCYHCAHKWRES
jgi:DNA-directed RNA polymerase subunit M/transcription elongation factor TFIIS